MASEVAPYLCARCASFDFDEILSASWALKLRDAESTFIANLGSLQITDVDSTCSLCKLLVSMRPTWLRYQAEGFALHAVIGRHFLWRPPLNLDKDKPVLVVVPLGKNSQVSERGWVHPDVHEALQSGACFTSTTAPIFPSKAGSLRVRAIHPTCLDYAIPRQWLEYCQSNHDFPCSGRNGPYPVSLKLINCVSRELESPKHPVSYLALSYVWGRSVQAETTWNCRKSLPLSLPKTVDDAIVVTKSLGYTYLWVDKYCIDQADEEDKMHQIRQMDLVYLNAEMTIVAGAGDDSEAGLPGVSSVQRTPPPQAQTENHQLVSLSSNIKECIERSTWNSRGWTFQEAVLSRRLLIFTEQQMYFECHCTRFWETVNVVKDADYANIFLQKDERQGYPWYFFQRVAQYVRRKLTHEDDILNAIQGVLSSYQRSENPIYHHWGVPILPPHDQARGRPNSILGSWSDGFVAGLCWQNKTRGNRRLGFPSWSWTGWNITLSDAKSSRTAFGRNVGRTSIEVEFEDQNGSAVLWDIFWSSRDQQPNLSLYIHLTVQTIPLVFKCGHLDCVDNGLPESDHWATFDKDNNTTILVALSILSTTKSDVDYHTQLTTDTFLGVIIGESYNHDTIIIVLRNCGGFFERIGHLNLYEARMRRIQKELGELTPISSWKLSQDDWDAIFLNRERKHLRIG